VNFRGNNPTVVDVEQSPPVRIWLTLAVDGYARGASIPIRWETAAKDGRIRGTVNLDAFGDMRTAKTRARVKGPGIDTDFGEVDLRHHDVEVWLGAELRVTGAKVVAWIEMVPRDAIAAAKRETFLQRDQGRAPLGPVVELHAAGPLNKSNALVNLEADREIVKAEAIDRIRVEGVDKA